MAAAGWWRLGGDWLARRSRPTSASAAHVAELKGDVEEGDVAVEGLEQEPLDDERVVVRLLFTPGAVKRRC